jgi:hypothetical protein
MKTTNAIKYWLPVTAIGIIAISIFAWMAIENSITERPQTINNESYILPEGIEALDLNIDTVKVIVKNDSQVPLLDNSSDYVYDGFISRDNGTNLDVIFTIYDKTNSTLNETIKDIPGAKHGPEFTKIMDKFIIHVDNGKKLGVYARK